MMDLAQTSVLVTGADGFIGSHLVEVLVRHGARVRALALYNSFNSWGWLDSLPSLNGVEVVAGDVRDAHFCQKLTQGIDVVFNLAALIAIPFSYLAPQSYLDTNAKGAINLCQAALQSGVKRFVQMSTSEVYGTARYVPIDEGHPLQAQSPYSASKIAADAIATSFHHSFGLPVIIARPFNTYGPRQSARAVIPTVITQIAAGKKEISLGDVTPTRDFNYVLDTCDGLMRLAACDAAVGEVVNIGSNYEISVADLFHKIRQHMGSDATLCLDADRLRPAQSEVRRLWCDNGKIHKLTGFSPKHTLDEGLAITIAWFQNPQNLKGYKAGIYNV